ncbi:TPA: hypothetical protein QB326_001517 [Pasteurella multocida]|nr:hypothetical protein [Pasteurella multocida]HDR1169696.1 hypothetical protein [Pasteurella multocida]HDR1175554.1 hypothetical protein [Pasteurella multocida]
MRNILLLLVLFPLSVIATDKCKTIQDDQQRLSCYDSHFGRTDSKNEVSSSSNSKSLWLYDETKDQMRGTTTYKANLTSNNSANFGSPYGESKLDIVLRKKPNSNDVLFIIHSGQFKSCYRECYVAMKFDDGKVETIELVEASSGSSDVRFIYSNSDVKKFSEKLKKSKRLILEFSFYDFGSFQFNFNVEGLDWKYF